jgi:hypothetical protein
VPADFVPVVLWQPDQSDYQSGVEQSFQDDDDLQANNDLSGLFPKICHDDDVDRSGEINRSYSSQGTPLI